MQIALGGTMPGMLLKIDPKPKGIEKIFESVGFKKTDGKWRNGGVEIVEYNMKPNGKDEYALRVTLSTYDTINAYEELKKMLPPGSFTEVKLMAK